MKKLGLLIMVLCVVSLMGCTMFYKTDVMPPLGFAYTDISAPMDDEFNGEKVTGQKGEATSTSILGLIATGDASITAAARQGNLKRVNHADYTYYNVLGVYQRFTTVVYGE